jgi:hypothetical protein
VIKCFVVSALAIQSDDPVSSGQAARVVPEVNAVNDTIGAAQIDGPGVAAGGHPAAYFDVIGFTIRVMDNNTVKIDCYIADTKSNAAEVTSYSSNVYGVVIDHMIDLLFSQDLPAALSGCGHQANNTNSQHYRQNQRPFLHWCSSRLKVIGFAKVSAA